jgi:hypothetical protein
MTFPFIPQMDNLDDNPYARLAAIALDEASRSFGDTHAMANAVMGMAQSILALALEIRRRPHVIDLKSPFSGTGAPDPH